MGLNAFTFRPATEAEIAAPKGQPPPGKYEPLLAALRDGPQVVEWHGPSRTFMGGVYRSAYRLGLRVSVHRIDETHFIVSEARR